MEMKIETLLAALNLMSDNFETGCHIGLEVIESVPIDSKIKEILKNNILFLIYCINHTTGEKQTNLSKIIPKKKDIEKNFRKIVNSPNNNIFVDWIIELGDCDYILELAKNLNDKNKSDLSNLSKVVCESKNKLYINRFAYEVPGANLSQLCNAICETNDAEYIYYFARNIPQANLSHLCDAICEAKDAAYIYRFASDIPQANRFQLCEAICKTNDAEYLYWFAKYIPEANLSQLCDAICETSDAEYLYLFAKNIPEANQSQLCEAICKTKDAEFLYKFAKNIPAANRFQLCETICKTNDAEFLYKFAKNIPAANQSQLCEAICETKDAAYIYEFARNVPNVNISKLCDAVCETKDAAYIYQFAEKILNADLIKIATVLCKLESSCVYNVVNILLGRIPNVSKKLISKKKYDILNIILESDEIQNFDRATIIEAFYAGKLDVLQCSSCYRTKKVIKDIIVYPGEEQRKMELLNQINDKIILEMEGNQAKIRKESINLDKEESRLKIIKNYISDIKKTEENNQTSMVLFPHPLELAPYIETDEFNMQYCFKISNEIITNFELQNVSIEDTIRQTTNTDCCPGLILNYVIKAIRNQKKDRETCIKVLFQSFSSAPYDIYLPYITDLLLNNNLIPYEVDKKFIDEKFCKTEKNARLSQTL